jgi:hypothetical protein
VSTASASLGALALLLVSSGCRDRAETSNAAIAIANANATVSDFRRHARSVDAVDMGDRWRLSYNLPEGSTGGPLIVVVNKRSGEIVHIETEQ